MRWLLIRSPLFVGCYVLNLKALIKTASFVCFCFFFFIFLVVVIVGFFVGFFVLFFLEKIRLDISCVSSAKFYFL